MNQFGIFFISFHGQRIIDVHLSLGSRKFVPRSDKVVDKGLTLWNFMRLDFDLNLCD